MPSFGTSSAAHLATCDPQLQALFNEVIKHYDCSVICGHRNKIEQERAYDDGKSRAHFGESPHNKTPSDAADVVPYPVDWSDKESFIKFAGFVLGVASQMGIQVKWGGKFSWFDGPHFQLIKES